MKTTDSIKLWKTRIDNCKRSGQKVTDWCEANKLSRFAYYYWHRKIKELEASNKKDVSIFAEVTKKEVPKQHASHTNIEEPELTISWNEVSITVKDHRAVPMAAELLNRLVSSC